jgi:hypothetical protein
MTFDPLLLASGSRIGKTVNILKIGNNGMKERTMVMN